MNFRRFSKAIAAAVLAVGLVSAAGVAPASAAPTHTSTSQQDTGWGRK